MSENCCEIYCFKNIQRILASIRIPLLTYHQMFSVAVSGSAKPSTADAAAGWWDDRPASAPPRTGGQPGVGRPVSACPRVSPWWTPRSGRARSPTCPHPWTGPSAHQHHREQLLHALRDGNGNQTRRQRRARPLCTDGQFNQFFTVLIKICWHLKSLHFV